MMNTPQSKDHGPSSFKILFVEMGDWSKTAQFTFTVTCMFTFLLVYGFLQEYISISLFNRKLGLFLTLCQFLINSGLAILHRKVNKDSIRKIPLKAYLILAALQASNQAFTNLSMKYLNYPVKALFKSSRVVPTVLIGVCFMKKKYSLRDYCVVALLTIGLCLFLEGDATTSSSFHPLGVVFITLALAADGATVNLQEYYLRRHDASHDELVAYSYAIGSLFLLFATTVVTDDLYQGLIFMITNGFHAILAIFVFCFSGYIGVTCATALTKKFGALSSAICTTVRKAITVFLSYIIFPKPFTSMHCTGGVLFMSALIWKTLSSYQTAKSSNRQNYRFKKTVGTNFSVRERSKSIIDGDNTAVRHRHHAYPGQDNSNNFTDEVDIDNNLNQNSRKPSNNESENSEEGLSLPFVPSVSSYLPSFPSVISFPNLNMFNDSRSNLSKPFPNVKDWSMANPVDSSNYSLESTIERFDEDKLLESIEEGLDVSQKTSVVV